MNELAYVRHNLNLYRINEIRHRNMDIAKESWYGSQHDLMWKGGEIVHLYTVFILYRTKIFAFHSLAWTPPGISLSGLALSRACNRRRVIFSLHAMPCWIIHKQSRFAFGLICIPFLCFDQASMFRHPYTGYM
jgi:hypothetical protein